MPVQLRLALRYFWAFSKQTVINRINAIALSVVVIATAALMIVLSAFGGLKDFGLSFTQSLHPTYRVLPSQGKKPKVAIACPQNFSSLGSVLGLLHAPNYFFPRPKN